LNLDGGLWYNIQSVANDKETGLILLYHLAKVAQDSILACRQIANLESWAANPSPRIMPENAK
jgi:hypothetical protein